MTHYTSSVFRFHKLLRPIVTIVLLLGAVGLEFWVSQKIPPGRLDLTTQEEDLFIQKLNSEFVKRPRMTITCTLYSESDCVLANRFLKLFARAQWPLANANVERLILLRPSSGIQIRAHTNTPPDLRNPLATYLMDETKTKNHIVAAFHSLGIDPVPIPDFTMKRGEYGIHFGIDSANRSTKDQIEKSARVSRNGAHRARVIYELEEQYRREVGGDLKSIPTAWLNEQLKVRGEKGWGVRRKSPLPNGHRLLEIVEE